VRRSLAPRRRPVRTGRRLRLGHLGDRPELPDHRLGAVVRARDDRPGRARHRRARLHDGRGGLAMSRRGWIITLVAVGVALAIVIGALANSQSADEQKYCDSLQSMQTALTSLTSLDPKTASSDEVQSDID